jgi:hypothetical protein
MRHVVGRLKNPAIIQTRRLWLAIVLGMMFFNGALGLLRWFSEPISEEKFTFVQTLPIPTWLSLTARILSYSRTICSCSGFLYLISYEAGDVFYSGGHNFRQRKGYCFVCICIPDCLFQFSSR